MTNNLPYEELIPALAEKAILAAATKNIAEAETICFDLLNAQRGYKMHSNSTRFKIVSNGLEMISAHEQAKSILSEMKKFFPGDVQEEVKVLSIAPSQEEKVISIAPESRKIQNDHLKIA